jgi:hypothetical protein
VATSRSRIGTGALLMGLAVALSACSSHPAASLGTSTTSTSTSTSSTTTTTTTVVTSGGSSSTSSTTTTAMPASCQASSLTVVRGRSSGATGTIGLGFVVRDEGSASCVLDGYAAVTLVPASGAVHPVVTHLAPEGAVTVVGKGSAGFVLEYSDVPVDGQAACPAMTAVRVTLPYQGSTAITVPARFFPCGTPEPYIRISAVLSMSQYRRLVG